MTPSAGAGALAVAIHDVEPATFERCALIRDWLDDLGVERVTLLVIPAPRLHPFPARSPELANWLLDRVDAGDAVAQHGLQHRRARRARGRCGGVAAEYPGLDAAATIASVETGRNVLIDAGLRTARVRRARLRLHVRAARASRAAASTGGRRC